MLTRAKEIGPLMMAAIAKQRALMEEDGGAPSSLEENRAQQTRLAPYWAEGAPEVGEIRDIVIPGPHGDRNARLYRPGEGDPSAIVIFLHGGGWARGSIATGEWACRAFAAESRLSVLSLDYSLAPEHPFPAAIDDIRATMDWCAGHGDELAGNGERVILTGTSAGANLSIAAALARRDAGEVTPIGLGLLFGPYGDNLETDSYRAYGAGQYGLSQARMKQYFDWYVPAGVDPQHPLISPVHADLAGLPETLVAVAEFDVLRDDSFLLAGRLLAARVSVSVRHYRDLAHGYALYARGVPAARGALSDMTAFFRDVAHRA
jgi:acetyl esterase